MSHGRYRVKVYCFILLSIILSLNFQAKAAYGWNNGGYSSDPSNPNYGTHDWIAQHALDWLPLNEKIFILDNLAIYLYGTELPDRSRATGGIGDTSKHHVYYRSDGRLQNDSAAIRAQEEFELAVSLYRNGNIRESVKRLGAMTHYISDMAVFGHVMGSSTDWGREKHHKDYEDYVNQRTDDYIDEFNVFLSFDGTLDLISAYNATLRLAFDTTFDSDGDLTCIWMDANYNWNDPAFRARCGESLNLAVNLVTDVLHTFYLAISPSVANITFHAEGLVNDALSNILIVDNVSYTRSGLPKSFTWEVGSTHSFEWMDIVDYEEGTRYKWISTNGLSNSRKGSIEVLSSGGNVTAIYGIQHYLETDVNPKDTGSVSPASGWYNKGSQLELSATPNPGYGFANWTGFGSGSYTGSSNPIIIKLDAPITQIAHFKKFNFTISISPSDGTISQGKKTVVTINVNLVSGLPKKVTLSISGLPNGASASIIPQSGIPPFQSTLTIETSHTVQVGSYVITIIGECDEIITRNSYALTIKPPESPLIFVLMLLTVIIIFLFIIFLFIILRRKKG